MNEETQTVETVEAQGVPAEPTIEKQPQDEKKYTDAEVDAIVGKKIAKWKSEQEASFRAVLFRMVPKRALKAAANETRFRAVLFRMVPKPSPHSTNPGKSFRAVLFRMVPKLSQK